MKKVLIVEDQRMPRENMERILLDSGKYALSASVNGADVARPFVDGNRST